MVWVYVNTTPPLADPLNLTNKLHKHFKRLANLESYNFMEKLIVLSVHFGATNLQELLLVRRLHEWVTCNLGTAWSSNKPKWFHPPTHSTVFLACALFIVWCAKESYSQLWFRVPTGSTEFLEYHGISQLKSEGFVALFWDQFMKYRGILFCSMLKF